MRSIPAAIVWELWPLGKWRLLLGVLGANVFTVLILSALRQEAGGALPSADPSIMAMHIMLTQLNMFIFAMTVFWSQGNVSRLYAKPITNIAIAHWHLLPTMVLTAAEWVVSTAMLNYIFQFNWPLWGPALFVATSAASIQAVFWLTEKSTWLIAGLTVVSGVLGIWFKSRYGEPFSSPSYYWTEVKPAEVATLALFVAMAYGVAIAGIARNRRGESVISFGILAWVNQLVDQIPALAWRFRSPLQAQFWFEWRQKGWLMPCAVLIGIFFGFGCWLAFNRDLEGLLEEFIVGGGLLSIAALLLGATSGNVGNPEGNPDQIAPFIATRPITTPDLARTILKMTASSVLLGWMIWAACLAGVYVACVLSHSGPTREMWNELGWWYFPATLVGPWIIAGVLTCLGLTGRPHLFIKLVCAAVALATWLPLYSRFALSVQDQVQFNHGLAVVAGILFSLGTVAVFAAALRRMLIGWLTVSLAIGGTFVLFALITLMRMQRPELSFAVYLLLLGIACLAVAPMAAAPLALAWNRHR